VFFSSSYFPLLVLFFYFLLFPFHYFSAVLLFGKTKKDEKTHTLCPNSATCFSLFFLRLVSFNKKTSKKQNTPRRKNTNPKETKNNQTKDVNDAMSPKTYSHPSRLLHSARVSTVMAALQRHSGSFRSTLFAPRTSRAVYPHTPLFVSENYLRQDHGA